jgi:hypothetical protein
MRVVMPLAEGDEVAFAMPGHLEALYRFLRRGPAFSGLGSTVEETRS